MNLRIAFQGSPAVGAGDPQLILQVGDFLGNALATRPYESAICPESTGFLTFVVLRLHHAEHRLHCLLAPRIRRATRPALEPVRRSPDRRGGRAELQIEAVATRTKSPKPFNRTAIISAKTLGLLDGFHTASPGSGYETLRQSGHCTSIRTVPGQYH